MKNYSNPSSIYTIDEVEKLILSAERYSATGKRNYAALLLAVRLGFRVSDICRLKFENLHWQTSTIKIDEYKTGKEFVVNENLSGRLNKVYSLLSNVTIDHRIFLNAGI
ncbi:MAG: tyrosine-type recombinase/integrase [Daejeonella sp.]